MIAAWAADYIGIPYADHGRDGTGVDCWGLVWLALQREYGVEMPSMSQAYDATQLASLDDLIGGNLSDRAKLPPNEIQAGDILFFTQAGHVSHCGLAVGDGRMIHAQDGGAVVMESYQSGVWQRRLYGAYRVI